MDTLPLPRERAKYEDDGASLRVILPPRRTVFLMVFLALWLAMWFGGARQFFRDLAPPNANADRTFSIIWLAIWVGAGVAAASTFIWMLLGREIIELGPDRLILRRAVFGLGRARPYDLAYIKDLRVGAVVPSLFDGSMFTRLFTSKGRDHDFSRVGETWGLAGGPIVFDYGPRTIRCGAALDEAEAKLVIERMRRRNSRLRNEGAA